MRAPAAGRRAPLGIQVRRRAAGAVAVVALASVGCRATPTTEARDDSSHAAVAPTASAAAQTHCAQQGTNDAACPGEPANPPPSAPRAGTRPGVLGLGSPVSGRPATPLAKVLEAPEAFAGRAVVVEGRVRRACSRKGCWMELTPSSADAAAAPSAGVRVTFKDYAFFVPTDSAGANARVEGLIEVGVVSKARVDHLESEGATFAHKNADGTAHEPKLIATGVELTRS